MNGVYFEFDSWALIPLIVILTIIIFGIRWRDSFAPPTLFFSNLDSLKLEGSSWKVSMARLPQWLEYAALGLFLMAFLDPRLQVLRQGGGGAPGEGIAIYLVEDRSGSMAEKSSVEKTRTPSAVPTKIDLLKQITKQFVAGDSTLGLEGRHNDLIGLVAFARIPQVLVPLTLDHQTVLDALSKIQPAGNKDEDGTAIGYAIYKTVNYIAATRSDAHQLSEGIRPAYDIKSSIIILVTDGFQEPNPLDQGKRLRSIGIMEAARYAKEKDVRLYVINVEPAFASSDFEPHRNLFRRATELTGGKFYMTASGMKLGQIYAAIDKLEKSAISADKYASLPKDQQPNRYRRISFYPILIILGLLALISALIFRGTLVKTVP